MKKQSKRKTSLKSSILLLLLAAILLISSTYAWFTANTTVTISQLEVNVEAKNGLQIAADGVNFKTTLATTDLTGATYATGVTTLKNQIPATLQPVSTAGVVDSTDGHMNMYFGTITNDLLTATKETDTNGTTGKYIAFDIYLYVTADTNLQMTTESNVKYTDTVSKGLENAARVAYVIEGNTAYGSGDATIQNLKTAVENPTALIWEPNNDTHTATGVSHASSVYGITTYTDASKNTALSPYYGIKAEIGTGVAQNSTNTSYFAAVTPTYSTINGKTTGTDIFSLSAGITKVRVYMWVEGQDVDCENNASGAKLGFNLQFAVK